MLQPRILSREASLTSLATALNNLALCSQHASKSQRPQLIFIRNASHAAQGRANGPKDSAGRRLGAKKSQSEWVIPGNIIFKQRGTKWFPGENVGMGKDHTIFATVSGYVRYYRNPAIHPKRRYIGVALEKEGPGSKLPTPPNAPTRRRLGMYATPIKEAPLNAELQAAKDAEFLQAHIAEGSKPAKAIPHPSKTAKPGLKPFDPQNMVRAGGHGISNYEIGKAAEVKGVRVKEFDRKDRWTAWRVRAQKVKQKMLDRAAKANRKTKGKKSVKKV